MPIAAAAYALLTAVCTLTNGAPSIRVTCLSTPDSSTMTTVTGTSIDPASVIAVSTIDRAMASDRVGRVVGEVAIARPLLIGRLRSAPSMVTASRESPRPVGARPIGCAYGQAGPSPARVLRDRRRGTSLRPRRRAPAHRPTFAESTDTAAGEPARRRLVRP